MAILGPSELPYILKVDSDPLKKYALSKLGYPVVEVEVEESQWESVLRTTGNFIAQYFSKEQKFAVFYTTALESTYDLPTDAYWIQEVSWDPVTTMIDKIFGAEAFLFNIGNITGIQQILTDYHLLQSYRRFSQRILGNEGHWEVLGDNKIRLYPTPKGAFPVVVLYIPAISTWRTPSNRLLAMDMVLAETMVILGHARKKFSGIPAPDGGTLTLDGDALVQAGTELREKVMADALLLSTDPHASAIYRY
jgi:hypothetical protein